MSEKEILDPQRFDRNLGFMTQLGRNVLNNSVVAIAGTGGDGGEVAVKLARMGVHKFRLADPETFDLENLNRQEGSNYQTIGQNKAKAIANIIEKIHPDAEIELFMDGVTEGNIQEFVTGADVIIDETEYTVATIGIMIAREARKNNLPVFMGLNLGHGGQVTMYPPSGKTFEEHLGLDPDMSLEELGAQKVSLDKWVHRIPEDADMDVFKEVAQGNISAPSIVTGVGITASIMAAYISDFLIAKGTPDKQEKQKRLNRLKKIDANRGRSLFMTAHGERKFVRNKRFSLTVSALRATLRKQLGLTPLTHYSKPKR